MADFNFQTHEVTIGTAEWVIVHLPNGREVTVDGDGHVWTDGDEEMQVT